MATLVVRLFGELELRVGERPLAIRENRRQVTWLLAYLTLQGARPVSRRVLAERLWPDSPRGALKNLRTHLSYLREALREDAWRLTAPSPHTLYLDLMGAEVDVLAFDGAIASGDPAALAQAVALYQGPLLLDCPHAWAFQERRQREEALLNALQALAGEALAQDDAATALRWLERAAREFPLRESILRARMRALVRAGESAAALAAYHDFRRRLREEHGLEPGPETTALFRELRARSTAPAADLPRRPVLPSARYRRQFRAEPLGRGAELAEVESRLAAGSLVTLTGAGGIGKSLLADWVAHRIVHSHFLEGGAFVALDALADGALVPATVARSLGIELPAGQAAEAALVAFLAPRRFLLVLDNCEHLLAPCAALVGRLLADCPHLRTLATSRQRLGLAEEALVALPPLAVPPAKGAPLDQLTASPAVQLFLLRAGLADTMLDERMARAITEICRRLDGLPLALELAAARVKGGSLTLTELARGLREHRPVLGRSGAAAPPRHRTLAHVLDWSYARLSAAEQRLFRRLAVFAGGWALEAVLQGGEASRSGEETREDPIPLFSSGLEAPQSLLLDLVEKSLVVAEEREGETRYRLLEPVREYAVAKLKQAGEERGAQRRHFRYHFRLALRARAPFGEVEAKEELDRLEREHDNLRVALAGAVESGEGQEVRRALRLAAALWGFWGKRGYTVEARERLTELLSLPEARAPTLSRVQALQALAMAALDQHDYRSGRTVLEEQLAIARRLPPGKWTSREARCAALVNLASVYGTLTQPDEALACRDEALEQTRVLLAEARHPAQKRRARSLLAYGCQLGGSVAIASGDFVTARRLLEKALAIRREIGEPAAVARTLVGLGSLARTQADYAQARLFLAESLAIRRELNDRTGLVSSLDNLAILLSEQGDYAAAEAVLQESLSLARALGRTDAVEIGLLGHTELLQGKFAAARAHLEEALALAEREGHSSSTAGCLRGLAEVALGEARYEEARSLGERALAICRQREMRYPMALLLARLAWVWLHQEQLPEARAYLQESLPILWETRTQPEVAAGLECLAALTLCEGQPVRAVRLLASADALWQTLGVPRPPLQAARVQPYRQRAQAALGAPEFDAAWEAGRHLPLAAAWEEGLGEPPPSPGMA